MRYQPPQKLAAGSSVVDAKEDMRAEVRSRPKPENGRLDFVQVECRRTRGSSCAGILNHDATTPLCLLNLVEKLVNCLTELLVPLDLSQSQVGIGDEPA